MSTVIIGEMNGGDACNYQAFENVAVKHKTVNINLFQILVVVLAEHTVCEADNSSIITKN
ncbi:MAG: hypothetical protein R2883_05485 [Caldisericia bacterium]